MCLTSLLEPAFLAHVVVLIDYTGNWLRTLKLGGEGALVNILLCTFFWETLLSEENERVQVRDCPWANT